MRKIALFPFNGEPMCFIHVLLNALDMHARGWEAALVIEGAAVKLIPEMAKEDNKLHTLYSKAKAAGVIAGACKACSAAMGVTEAAQAEGLELLGDMNGHPSIAGFIEQGYEIVTF